jgi:hypothetical protein
MLAFDQIMLDFLYLMSAFTTWFQKEGIPVVVGVVSPPHSPLEVKVFLG